MVTIHHKPITNTIHNIKFVIDIQDWINHKSIIECSNTPNRVESILLSYNIILGAYSHIIDPHCLSWKMDYISPRKNTELY